MTNDVDVNRKARVNRTSGKLFCLAGLLFVLSGLIDGNIGRYILIGMMNVCVGLIFLSMAKRTEKPMVTATIQTQKCLTRRMQTKQVKPSEPEPSKETVFEKSSIFVIDSDHWY